MSARAAVTFQPFRRQKALISHRRFGQPPETPQAAVILQPPQRQKRLIAHRRPATGPEARPPQVWN
jgi:hypothetical protein